MNTAQRGHGVQALAWLRPQPKNLPQRRRTWEKS